VLIAAAAILRVAVGLESMRGANGVGAVIDPGMRSAHLRRDACRRYYVLLWPRRAITAAASQTA